MCIAQPKAIAAPTVAAAPTRGDATVNPVGLVNDAKNIIAKRQGTFGNIRTTPLGDANYGSASFARFGAKAA